MNNSLVELTLHLTDRTLSEEERDETTRRLLQQLKHMDEVETAHLVADPVSSPQHKAIACLVDTRKADKTDYGVLFYTDVDLDAERIVAYYKARFQLEFIFRDAKQFTGLCDAQTRQPQTLDFHFNASLTALNLVKYEFSSFLGMLCLDFGDCPNSMNMPSVHDQSLRGGG